MRESKLNQIVAALRTLPTGRGLPRQEKDRPPAGSGFIEPSGEAHKRVHRFLKLFALHSTETSSASRLPINHHHYIKQNPAFQKTGFVSSLAAGAAFF